MRKQMNHLLIFLAATFAWTWGFYAPIALGRHNPYEMPWMPFLILGGMGPSVMGIAMVLLTGSQEQRRDFWQRCFSVRRIGPFSWGIIFLIFPLVFGVSIAFDRLLGGSLPGMKQWISLMVNPVMWPLAAFISFLSGPWAEEFGWRGFALDRFLQRFGTILGSIGLGLVWAVWHLPLYWMSTTWHAEMGFKLAGFWTFILLSVSLSLIMTWVYLASNRSILSGMLLHFTSNFTGQLLAPTSDTVEMVRVVLMLSIGLTACFLMVRANRSQLPFSIKKHTYTRA